MDSPFYFFFLLKKLKALLKLNIWLNFLQLFLLFKITNVGLFFPFYFSKFIKN